MSGPNTYRLTCAQKRFFPAVRISDDMLF